MLINRNISSCLDILDKMTPSVDVSQPLSPVPLSLHNELVKNLAMEQAWRLCTNSANTDICSTRRVWPQALVSSQTVDSKDPPWAPTCTEHERAICSQGGYVGRFPSEKGLRSFSLEQIFTLDIDSPFLVKILLMDSVYMEYHENALFALMIFHIDYILPAAILSAPMGLRCKNASIYLSSITWISWTARIMK